MVCCNACRATKEFGMLNIGQLRNLNNNDLPAALELSTLAGWNQTADDWRMLLELAPDGCFGMEVGGHVVVSATLVCYGDRLGWIGMVLTHPEFRHQGFACELFERVLAYRRTRKQRRPALAHQPGPPPPPLLALWP